MSAVTAFSTAHYGGAVGTNQSKAQCASTDTKQQADVDHHANAVNVTLSAIAKSSAADVGTLDFASVAKNARAALDAGYEKTGATSSIHTQGSDWKEIMGGLDRRSLYAIASNEGGQFSQVEQDTARYFMAEQQSSAMKNGNPGGNDFVSGYKSVIHFLESVSTEEKSSIEWAKDRAVVQVNYEMLSRKEGTEDKSLDSDNPFVKMIKQALYRLHELQDPTKKLRICRNTLMRFLHIAASEINSSIRQPSHQRSHVEAATLMYRDFSIPMSVNWQR